MICRAVRAVVLRCEGAAAKEAWMALMALPAPLTGPLKRKRERRKSVTNAALFKHARQLVCFLTDDDGPCGACVSHELTQVVRGDSDTR